MFGKIEGAVWPSVYVAAGAVLIYFFYLKFRKLGFFSVFKSINGILHKTPYYKYNICDLNYPFFNVFQGFTIFL